MPLTAGTRLGPYEILAPLGAGGMGEVYRARDSKLNRHVAIKILPEALAADPAARARFEREAQAVAALSHPNILGIFDFGVDQRVPYAVMELLDGRTLREQLQDGGVPPRKTIEYALQIAAGLAAAHAREITHRDLKPENIFLTRDGRVKILDFGLAKVGAPDVAGVAAIQTLTPTFHVTSPGTVLGTVGYMSPEQVRGREVDHRTDIFSFGAILYELLAGHRAFTGDSAVETMNAILTAEPAELTRANAAMPPALDRIVRRCLEKNPDERFQSARDVAFALDAISGTSGSAAIAPITTAAPRSGVRWAPTAIAVGAVVVFSLGAIVGGWVIGRLRAPSVAEGAVTRFTIGAPDAVAITIYSRPAVSPDGRFVAFVGGQPGDRDRIWLRSLDKLAARVIAGTENATAPFWSPDGAFIGFFSDGKLKKAPMAGGPPETLCDVPATGGEGPGGTWSRDGTILFSTTMTSGLHRVPAVGGEPTVVTQPDRSSGETAHLWPQFLPDGRHFLFSVATAGSARRMAFLGSLASADRRRLMDVRGNISYAPDGHVLFIRQGSLMAQRFDLRALELRGEPVLVSDEFVNVDASFSAAGSALVYFTATKTTVLAWFDRSGKQIRAIDAPGAYGWPALSPDGRRIAIDRVDAETGTRVIWLIDDERGVKTTRLTFDPSDESDVVWAPDGTRVAFAHDRGRALHEMTLGTTAGQHALIQFGSQSAQVYPTDWSSDGRFIAYSGFGPTVTADIWLLPLGAQAKPIAFAATKFSEHQARFSPDGQWISYASDQSGRPEVYVQAMPPAQARSPISAGGGAQPMWRRDGKELFYLALDGTLMAVPLRSGMSIESGVPVPLFKVRIEESLFTAVRNHYAVTPDGQRFLINSVTAGANQLSVVLHWTAMLGK